mmetsp:Transcript_17498/g.43656  ORF Transcript_17498/g.43656 Transcript_17498/m.43656 type:complete len:624 (-) Transcript_17498:1052-2923(-)
MRGRRRRNEGEGNQDVHNFDIDSDSSDESPSSTENSDFAVSESEISYSIESFNAVATPVTITMIISALVVVFINTPETIAAGEEIYAKTYQIFRVGGENQTTVANLGYSLVNTLVIVSVICALTFVVVLCYKFRCMKLFYAYMVLVTAALLGFFTLQIFMVAISIYPWLGNIDKLSLAFVLYNYAAVGTLAIFLPRGFPKWVTQGYLIAGSVCMAWELSFFNEWMTWCLLVMLALYDLFAVLTPCGPLKALANLISREGAPSLPGMLYEADLPSGAQRRSTRSSRRNSRTSEERRERQNGGQERHENSGNNSAPSNPQATGTQSQRTTPMNSMTESNSETSLREESISQQSREPRWQMDNRGQEGLSFLGEQQQFARHGQQQISHQQSNESQERALPPVDMSNRGKVPLVLARMYKLPVLDKRGVLRSIGQTANESSRVVRQHQIYYSAEEILETEWTPQQLKTEVTCIFPPRGGRIARARSRDQRYDAGTAYIVYSRSGEQQRKFVVTPTGAVKEVLLRETQDDSDDDGDGDKRNTIKLGIGDFIFYSLLVSQAAQNSFTAFAACLLVVLMGLAATLVILAIKGKALPALPISIFLGVIAFLWTTYFVKPWIDGFIVQSIYV